MCDKQFSYQASETSFVYSFAFFYDSSIVINFLSSSTQVLNQSSQTKVKKTNLNLPSRDKSSLQSILISSAYKLSLNLFLNILYFLEKVPRGRESTLTNYGQKGGCFFWEVYFSLTPWLKLWFGIWWWPQW